MQKLDFFSAKTEQQVKDLLASKTCSLTYTDQYGRTPLEYFACLGEESWVKLLLDAKANVDSQSKVFPENIDDDFRKSSKKYTPLLLTCHHDKKAHIAKLLVDHKADVNARDYKDKTPLFRSVTAGATDTVRVLCEAKADVNEIVRETDGGHILEYGTTPRRIDIMRVLIEYKSDPNARTGEWGSTILFDTRNKEEVEFLLRMKADPLLVNDVGLTPMKYNTVVERAYKRRQVVMFMCGSLSGKLKIAMGRSHFEPFLLDLLIEYVTGRSVKTRKRPLEE